MGQPLDRSDRNTTNLEKQVAHLQRYRLPLLASVAVLSVIVVQTCLARPECQTADLVECEAKHVQLDHKDGSKATSPLELAETEPTQVELDQADDSEVRSISGLAETGPEPEAVLEPTPYSEPVADVAAESQLAVSKSGWRSLFASVAGSQAERPVSSAPFATPPESTIEEEPQDTEATTLAGCLAYTELLNPPDSDCEIRFLVDGEIQSLHPGESRQLAAEFPLLVQFHRGDDFGDAEHLLQGGVFEFRVNSKGWELQQVDEAGSAPADR